jgi:hypothetical protein
MAVIPASTRQRTTAIVTLAVSLLYLTRFVSRGWIAHDEGMLGQSAERVLHGELPHVAYEEPYTGGLSWIYAQVFRFGGPELLHIRWVMFAVAAAAVCILYVLLRRFASPPAAALGAWLGLAWSFPTYFAGLPSWWLLTCALACLWALVRLAETRDVRYGALAGLTAATAVVIKQTGIYLVVALLLSLAFTAAPGVALARKRRIFGACMAVAAAAFAAVLLTGRLFAAEGLYLFSPIAACSAVLLHRSRGYREHPQPNARLWIATCCAACVPLALLLFPYLKHGTISQLVYGALILPRKRLAYASYAMPPAILVFTGIPLLGLFIPIAPSRFIERSVIHVVMWTAALVLPIVALANIVMYQLIWQSTRAFAVGVPIAICYCLMTDRVRNTSDATVLYASASVLAWVSLNQFPFASPVYFAYTAPLVVVAAVALAASNGSLRRTAILPWSAMLLLFAVMSLDRTYVDKLGIRHAARYFDARLELPRAHLSLEPSEAEVYRRAVGVIEQHLTNGRLVAGPDSPELYYLTGTRNESGTFFDFFSESDNRSDSTGEWMEAEVIAINHRPAFSAEPKTELITQLRSAFPAGEQIGRFEVRWR